MDEATKILKERIDKIENVDIRDIRNDIERIEINLNTNTLLTRQATESNEKLATAMESIKDAMVELGSMTKDTNEQVGYLKDRVSKIDTKVEKVDNKSKWDILEFVKNNIVGIIMAVGALSYFLSQLM